jgi:hypothetical protein
MLLPILKYGNVLSFYIESLWLPAATVVTFTFMAM